MIDFGSTTSLFHGTHLDKLWLIMQDGQLHPYNENQGPAGVSLSRSFKVAYLHGKYRQENLQYSFFEYFDLGDAPDWSPVVFEFQRDKIKGKIIPYHDLGPQDEEEEERVLGAVSFDALVGIHLSPSDVRDYLRKAKEAFTKGGHEYDATFAQILKNTLEDPRIKILR